MAEVTVNQTTYLKQLQFDMDMQGNCIAALQETCTCIQDLDGNIIAQNTWRGPVDFAEAQAMVASLNYQPVGP
jgi:hypothetical protein